jgi:hypothetical protein
VSARHFTRHARGDEKDSWPEARRLLGDWGLQSRLYGILEGQARERGGGGERERERESTHARPDPKALAGLIPRGSLVGWRFIGFDRNCHGLVIGTAFFVSHCRRPAGQRRPRRRRHVLRQPSLMCRALVVTATERLRRWFCTDFAAARDHERCYRPARTCTHRRTPAAFSHRAAAVSEEESTAPPPRLSTAQEHVPEAVVRRLRAHMECHPDAFDPRCLERDCRLAALATPVSRSVSHNACCQGWCIGAVALARCCVAVHLLGGTAHSVAATSSH